MLLLPWVRVMNNFFNWCPASQKFSMQILQGLQATVLSIANDYLYMSIAVMGLYMIHCMGMIIIVSNSHGMHAFRWHLELQELQSEFSDQLKICFHFMILLDKLNIGLQVMPFGGGKHGFYISVTVILEYSLTRHWYNCGRSFSMA